MCGVFTFRISVMYTNLIISVVSKLLYYGMCIYTSQYR